MDAQEQRRFRRWLWACRIGALSFAGFYVYLLIGAKVTHPIYLLVNLLSLVTGLMGFAVVANFSGQPDSIRAARKAALGWVVFASTILAVVLWFRPEFGVSLADRLAGKAPADQRHERWHR